MALSKSSPSDPLTYAEIQQAIRASFSALSMHGLEACLFGSATMLAYGMEHRLPKDVDLLILNATPAQTDEDVKDLVVSSDPASFFLTDSKKQGATYRILWYALRVPAGPEESGIRTSSTGVKSSSNKKSTSNSKSKSKKHASAEHEPDAPSSSSSREPQQQPKTAPSRGRACKIDILLPATGALDIPHIPKDRLFFDASACFLSYASLNSSSSLTSYPTPTSTSRPTPTPIPTSIPRPTPIPNIPFPSLLSLKLRAWADHSLRSVPDNLRARVVDDEEDIEELLRIAGSGVMGSSPSREVVVVRFASGMGTEMGMGDGEDDGGWMHAGFRTWKEARRAVGVYTRKWPGTKSAWGAVGFGL